ncbi:hypothetical protein PTKIN_Ptkin18bG0018500 [Pterospermum kingtungense]
METSEEETTVFLDLTSRPTRGKRMTKLLDEEAEEDELFWNQDAFKEEENDANYEEEPEVADVFDSDFDEDEPEPDEEVENEADERVRPKKRLIFPGKSSKKKKKKKKVLSKLDGAAEDEKPTEKPTSLQHHDAPDDAEGERIIRKSTRTSVIVKQAERDAIRAALQATMKPIKRKKEGEEKRMTQEEMLLEAAQTGSSYLEFSKGLSFHSELSTASPPCPEKSICAVTGLPAKYRDPKTGLCYATKEAFKIIRERFEDERKTAQKEMDMGVLFDSLSGKGLMPRRKRSRNSNTSQTSCFQYWGHFNRSPSGDDEDDGVDDDDDDDDDDEVSD